MCVCVLSHLQAWDSWKSNTVEQVTCKDTHKRTPVHTYTPEMS